MVGPVRARTGSSIYGFGSFRVLILAETIAPGRDVREFHQAACMSRSPPVKANKNFYDKVVWNLHLGNLSMVDGEQSLHPNELATAPREFQAP